MCVGLQSKSCDFLYQCDVTSVRTVHGRKRTTEIVMLEARMFDVDMQDPSSSPHSAIKPTG